MITGINSGGPLLIIYGIILIAIVSIGVGVSLSELASAMPNAGGQYFWANELAPKRFANFASLRIPDFTNISQAKGYCVVWPWRTSSHC